MLIISGFKLQTLAYTVEFKMEAQTIPAHLVTPSRYHLRLTLIKPFQFTWKHFGTIRHCLRVLLFPSSLTGMSFEILIIFFIVVPLKCFVILFCVNLDGLMRF